MENEQSLLQLKHIKLYKAKGTTNFPLIYILQQLLMDMKILFFQLDVEILPIQWLLIICFEI